MKKLLYDMAHYCIMFILAISITFGVLLFLLPYMVLHLAYEIAGGNYKVSDLVQKDVREALDIINAFFNH